MSPTQIPPKTEARLSSPKVEFLQIYNVQREIPFGRKEPYKLWSSFTGKHPSPQNQEKATGRWTDRIPGVSFLVKTPKCPGKWDMAGVRIRSGRRGKAEQSAGEARGRRLGRQSTRELPDLHSQKQKIWWHWRWSFKTLLLLLFKVNT